MTKHKVKRPTAEELKAEEPLPNFHFLTSEDAVSHFHSNADKGLTTAVINERLEKYGPNELFGDAGVSVWRVLFANTFNSMNAVLVTAFIVGMAVQDWIKAAVLLLVIVTNSGIGFAQEYKSEKTMDALRKMSSPTARVLRNKDWEIIAASDVVPGDIVALEEGDVVPADIRLLVAVNLECDEALLTGEALPISKFTRPVNSNAGHEDGPIPLGDRKNCVYRNTTVCKGRGVGVVFATGLRSEVGKIAILVSAKKAGAGSVTGLEKTPLQVSLDRMMFLCLGAAIILGVVVFAVNRFQWDIDIFLYAIAVGIAILPEGLPAVVTVSMAVGLRRMSQQKAVIRRLAALEAVGQVTNVCSDKTGTLTEGKMVVKTAWFAGKVYIVGGRALEPIGEITEGENLVTPEAAADRSALHQGLLACSLCITSSLSFDEEEKRWKATGDPTEVALQVFAAKVKYEKAGFAAQGYKFLAEFPFDSTIKRMTVAYEEPNKNIRYLAKGAVEGVLERCTTYIDENEQVVPVDEAIQARAIEVMEDFAGRGWRVLAVGTKVTPPRDEKMDEEHAAGTREEAESELTFLGLVAMYDPPRPESLPSVRECQGAGIVVHMATGDHPKTAEAIAREVGILSHGDLPGAPLVLTAAQFDAMSDEEVDKLSELPRVLARCSPESKVRLVAALHRRKKFVAMTGDGVNDAPAVRQADIGIAMGQGGSDVTKQASAITLTDDNFKTILVAIREGRRLFSNSSIIALHLLSGNVSEVVALVIGLAIRDEKGHSVFPMSAIQILWLNMVTSSPVALALGMELAPDDIMNYPPRAVDSSIWSREFIIDNLFYGITSVTFNGNLAALPTGCNKRYEEKCDPTFRARGMAFYSLSLLLLVHGFNCRHVRLSMFRRKQVQNKYLWFAVLLGLFVTVPSAYIPVIDTAVFNQLGFTWGWGFIIGQLFAFVAVSELYKLFKRNVWFRNEVNNMITLPDAGFLKSDTVQTIQTVNTATDLVSKKV
ncbi:potassium/sodium efflux P-type ATPase [Chytridium lagenaria]|nr:potassium/sodium efflux P-type ATPase [Chytridium lagenaria]